MRCPKTLVTILFCAVATVGCGQYGGTNARNADNATARDADNSRVNERDRYAGEDTADQQKENEQDRELTQKVRQSVMADDSLSTYAKNVKIISQNGTVTLKGPVNSEAEKKSIVARAVQAAGGAGRVIDEMSINR
jgi:hyperosmotically inducible periplasmic protein